MSTYSLTIAYDGSRFAGWAAQPGQRTVQSDLEAALQKITGQEIQLTVAGRTDAGVHAWAQVASFRTRAELPSRLGLRLNAVLAKDVSVLEVAPAPSGFDARRDARSRTYCYRLLASPVRIPFEEGRALWWPHPFDIDALRRCAAAVAGTHDFTAFTPTDTEHVRFERDVRRCKWLPEGDPESDHIWCFWIEADAFMRHMVRVIVGTMLEVGAGKRGLEDFERLLDGAPREAAGDTAAPHGLYLASVTY